MAARDPIDWHGAWSLSDYLIYLIAGKQTQSKEYQVMLRLLGQSKIDGIWKDHQEKNQSDPTLKVGSVDRRLHVGGG